jgi:hypothetical protein
VLTVIYGNAQEAAYNKDIRVVFRLLNGLPRALF